MLKNKYFRDKWEQTEGDSRKQWKFINTLLRGKDKQVHIETINVNGRVITDSKNIANELNIHFTKVGTNIVSELNNEILNLGPEHGNLLNFSEIYCENSIHVKNTCEKEVREIILNLKKFTAPGHDKVTVRDLNNLMDDIVPIITKLINNVFLTGTFPLELKISKITPVYKAGLKDCMDNYRPISVISTFSKVVEIVIKNRITSFMYRYVTADPYQYGFIKDSNTLSATTDLVNLIANEIDNKKIVIAVFIDLKKAFDVVSFDILLSKMYKLGIRGAMYNLIKTYLLSGEQYVKLDKYDSENKKIECGVPQGSVLGPLLYSLFVLSLRCSGLKARYFTFADDTALVYSFNSEDNLEINVNLDLQKYKDWLLCNRLKINIEKTKYMIFKQKNKTIGTPVIRINNFNIERVEKIKYLGLIIDDKLNWKEHINFVSDKIAPMICALYKNRNYLSKKSKMDIYNAYFLSHFRYLLPVWGNCGVVNFNTVQILQNKVLKILFNYDYLTHTAVLYRELGLNRLDTLLELEQCKLMHKIIHKKQKSNNQILFNFNMHTHCTRTQGNIHLNNIRTNKGIMSPLYRASIAYDKLPVEIRNVPHYNKFLKLTKHHLEIEKT